MGHLSNMQQFKPLWALLKRHKHWFFLLALIPLFEVVTAYGIAPDTQTQDIQQRPVVNNLTLPTPVATDSGNFDFWREERIQSGDTLPSIMNRLGVDADEIASISAVLRNRPMGIRFIKGRMVIARVTSNGHLLVLRYLANNQKLLSVERAGSTFAVSEEDVHPETRISMRSGTIKYSLFGATDAADVPDSIASEMADIFSGDIDFHRDIRTGDHFSVIYESQYDESGRVIGTGRLLAAEFVNDGNAYRAIYFKDPKGREGYFTPDGKNLKKAFLKSPLPFTRITSYFTRARFHPILKTWRAHKGIDYGAPVGTPVRAVADAVVTFAGQERGYGNIVVLKHFGPYSTAYGHLSRFAKGIHRGVHVQQGQIFAYTGKTGWATGPHLHFEFRVNNVQVNPLAVKLPSSYPLEAQYRSLFASESTPLVARLDQLSDHNLASLD